MSLWKKNGPSNGGYEKALSLLGEGSHTQGDFLTPGNLRIEGIFQGKLRVEGRLVIAPSADVQGIIHASQVHVAGKFSGEIIADDSVELSPTARVYGDIRARRMETQKGAIMEVRCFVGEDIYQKPEPESAAPNKRNRHS